jgi:hypothetical protein
VVNGSIVNGCLLSKGLESVLGILHRWRSGLCYGNCALEATTHRILMPTKPVIIETTSGNSNEGKRAPHLRLCLILQKVSNSSPHSCSKRSNRLYSWNRAFPSIHHRIEDNVHPQFRQSGAFFPNKARHGSPYIFENLGAEIAERFRKSFT